METIWMHNRYSLILYLKTSLICLLFFQPSLCRPPLNDDTLVNIPIQEEGVQLARAHDHNEGSENLVPRGDERNIVFNPAAKDILPHQNELGEEAVDDKFAKSPSELSVDKAALPADDLLPPDHIDGFRMEQDGHINEEYRKEIVFGNHEEFEEISEDKQEARLADMFDLMDADADGKVTVNELTVWIQAKVQEHYTEAIEETDRVFTHLDGNTDGFVAWTEFYMHYLLAKGFHPKEAAKYVVDDDAMELDPDVRERLLRYKFRWAEADAEPGDNQLTLEEFQNFRHPERSQGMLDTLVGELMDTLDKGDRDGVITEEEFVALPVADSGEAFAESDKLWQDDRRQEFRDVMDLDHDGKLTGDELTKYVDIGNPNHSKIEAENLVALADDNSDGVLSKTEVVDNMDIFLGSRAMNTGRNIHDEF